MNIYGYNIRYGLTHPWMVIQETYYRIKWFLQRGYRGYSNRDNWSIDGFLLQILPPMLKTLQKTKHGYPVDLTSKKWDKILKTIIVGLKANNKLCNFNYNWRDKKRQRQLKKQSDLGLKLFSEHFNSLWD